MKSMVRSRLLLLSMLAVIAAPATADVYMWRDANGTIHYGDRPGSDNARKLDVATGRTDDAAVRERYRETQQARLESNAAMADARTQQRDAREQAAEERDEQQQRCEAARERLQNYINSRRMYRLDDSGERQYLDDAEIDEARDRAEQAVKDACN